METGAAAVVYGVVAAVGAPAALSFLRGAMRKNHPSAMHRGSLQVLQRVVCSEAASEVVRTHRKVGDVLKCGPLTQRGMTLRVGYPADTGYLVLRQGLLLLLLQTQRHGTGHCCCLAAAVDV